MSDLYEAMASAWWDSLDATQRDAWLDAAQADGRERDPLAAYTLMGDLRAGYRPEDEAKRAAGPTPLDTFEMDQGR